MRKNQTLLKAFLACTILLSQPFFTPTVKAQSAVPGPYAQKLRAYDSTPPVLMTAANSAPTKIGPMSGSYAGSQWDYFTYAAFGWGTNTGWDIYFHNGNANPMVVSLAPGWYDEIQPRFSLQANKVVFVSNRDRNRFEIYTIKPDGTGLTQLTKNSTDDVYPSFSPDGSQVVFQAYRDGQPEIYKMKIDGTGVTRLTTNLVANANYDGMPVWSPDGSQIAFVTNRTGQYTYQLWLMNADGSNQRLLVDQPWCAHPSWSGDGKKIAFDAAVSITAYQSVWVYSFDAGQAEQKAASNSNLDYEVNAFMPGGRFVGFTSVDNATQDLATFLNSLDNFGLDVQVYTGQVKPMVFTMDGSEGLIWSFDWQSQDALPPVTTIQTLPAISPTPFVLQWGAQDAGPAGMDSYELQTKASPGDAWHDVSSYDYQSGTSLTVTGTHGQNFYYRVRAIDKAENAEAWKPGNEWTTTIESQPPHFVFAPSARYAPFPSGIFLNWQEWDDGGSGIDHYEFTTSVNSQCVGGQYFYYNGHMFQSFPGDDLLFCGRAVDRAGNVSNWAVMPNKVAFYYSVIGGQVLNNQGNPVSGAQVDLSANQLAVFPSDINGNFLAYTNAQYSSGTLGWTKSGYGSSTRWQFPPGQSLYKDAYLPPANDLIVNGGFENGFSQGDWQPGGDTLPEMSTKDAYLGSSAAKLGGPDFSLPVQLTDTCALDCDPQSVVSSSGTIHVIWPYQYPNNVYQDIYYAQKPAGGSWSSPKLIIVSSTTIASIKIMITKDDALHLVYLYNTKLYSMDCPANGSWSAPIAIFSSTWAKDAIFNMIEDGNGAIQLLVSATDRYYMNLYYCKWSGGVWSKPVLVDGPLNYYYSFYSAIAPDKNNNLFAVFWLFPTEPMLFTHQAPDGSWSPLAPVPTQLGMNAGAKLAIDAAGTVHMIFVDDQAYPASLYYMEFDSGKNAWSAPIVVSPRPTYSGKNALIATADGKLHLIWTEKGADGRAMLRYRLFTPGIGWSNIETPFSPEYNNITFAVTAHQDGSLHFLVENYSTALYYFIRSADGKFSAPHVVLNSSDLTGDVFLVVTPDKQPQFFWWNSITHIINSFLNTSGGQYAPQSGTSNISEAVSIPETMQNPGLSFLYQVFGPADSGNDFKVTATDGADTSTIFTAAGENQGYQHIWVDMSQWKGKQVTLTFSSSYHQGQSYPEVMLDEVSLGETYPDRWIDLSPMVAQGLPTQTVTINLHYGVHGLPVDQAAITLALPPEIEFVSADIPPAVDGNNLSWNVGDLSPMDGNQSISLAVRVRADAPAFNAFDLKACLASPTAELETMNNCAQNTIRSQASNYIPMVNK